MKPEYIMLIGVVVTLALPYVLGALLFPKTSWREDDPCGRS